MKICNSSFQLAICSFVRSKQGLSTFLVAANVFTLWYVALRNILRKPGNMDKLGKRKTLVITSCEKIQGGENFEYVSFYVTGGYK